MSDPDLKPWQMLGELADLFEESGESAMASALRALDKRPDSADHWAAAVGMRAAGKFMQDSKIPKGVAIHAVAMRGEAVVVRDAPEPGRIVDHHIPWQRGRITSTFDYAYDARRNTLYVTPDSHIGSRRVTQEEFNQEAHLRALEDAPDRVVDAMRLASDINRIFGSRMQAVANAGQVYVNGYRLTREHQEELRGQIAEVFAGDSRRLERLTTLARGAADSLDYHHGDRREADELRAAIADAEQTIQRETTAMIAREVEGLQRIVDRITGVQTDEST